MFLLPSLFLGRYWLTAWTIASPSVRVAVFVGIPPSAQKCFARYTGYHIDQHHNSSSVGGRQPVHLFWRVYAQYSYHFISPGLKCGAGYFRGANSTPA